MGALLLFLFLPPDATPEAAEEFKRLSGTWEVVKVETNGKVISREDSIWPKHIKFADTKPKGTDKRCDIYSIALNPKANPTRMTATVTGGEIKGDKILVIYEFDKDTLKMRLAYGAKDYPKGFNSISGDGTWVLVLRRIKE